MIETLVNRSCTIVRREDSGTANAYGDKVATETSVSTVCEIQQRGRGEGTDEVSDTRWIGFFLPAVELHAGDAVIVDAETYEVEGEPWRARNPRTGETSHVEATLRRTSGPGDEVGS